MHEDASREPYEPGFNFRFFSIFRRLSLFFSVMPLLYDSFLHICVTFDSTLKPLDGPRRPIDAYSMPIRRQIDAHSRAFMPLRGPLHAYLGPLKGP